MLNVLYIIGGIVGLLWLTTCGYFAYSNRSNKSKMWMWVGLSVIGLIPLFLSILHPGTGKPTTVVVTPHIRGEAPTPQQQAEADAQAEILRQQAASLKNNGTKLDQKAKELDEQRNQLEAEATETDQRIEKLAESVVSDAPAIRKPNPRTSKRLNGG
jgi:Skp family chaperone for outer membrane proteins